MWTARQPGRFVIGANLPWIDYGNDVGANHWSPEGGISVKPEALERLDKTLAALNADGITVVRFFLLCDARSGVIFDDNGLPLALDSAVFADLDAIVASARRHHVGLMPALIDFHLCREAEIVNGVQLGGRSHLIAQPDARTAFIDRILRPIIERYGTDDAVIAWDVMNEPEWCLRRHRFSRTGMRFDVLQDFLRQAVACVRQFARQPVTVGSAGTWQLDLVTPLGLDFYQVHWYERFGWSALVRPVVELGLADRPVILGEFAGRDVRLEEVLPAARQAGYEGALVWSVLADDQASEYPPHLGAWIRAQS